MYRSLMGAATIACLLSLCHVALAGTYLPRNVHAQDADLIESRAIAGLEFRDPGSVHSFLDQARQQRKMMNAARNVPGANTYATTEHATTADEGVEALHEEDTARLLAVKEKYGKDISSHFEMDMHADHELDAALSSGDWMNNIDNHLSNAKQVKNNVVPDMKARDVEPQVFSLLQQDDKTNRKLNMKLYGRNMSPGQPRHEETITLPQSTFAPVPYPKITLGQQKFEQLELGNLASELRDISKSAYPDARAHHIQDHVAAIKQMELDVEKVQGTLTYPLLKSLSKEIKTISGARLNSTQDITDGTVVDMIGDRSRGFANIEVSPHAGAIAPNGRDVVDCTACRFAWLSVEKDLGHSTDPVALYDSFVRHCGHMQLSNIFYAPCTDMFSKVENMIGNYLSGMTVNQMCATAEMCR